MMRERAWVGVSLLSVIVLAGCSSQDFGRPMGSITDILDSGPQPPSATGDALAAERAEQLTRALSAWDTQRGDSELDYRVGPDDVLEIAVFALETPGTFSTLTRTVARDGSVDLPLAGILSVGGLNVSEVTARIVETYRHAYLNNPRVSVSVKEHRSQPVVVTGAVMTPGIIHLRHNSSTVLEVLSMAQGLSALAGEKLMIVRKRPATGTGAEPPPGAEAAGGGVGPEEAALSADAEAELAAAEALLVAAAGAAEGPDEAADTGKADAGRDAGAAAEALTNATPPLATASAASSTGPLMIEVNLEALLKAGDMRMNVTIQGGDIVTIPPSIVEYVYVLGYVNSPGAYPMKGSSRISALKAVALANGLSPSARAANSLLIVEEEGRRKVTPVNLPAIARGATPPIYMQPGDTLLVGSSALAKIGEFIKPSVSAGASYSPAP